MHTALYSDFFANAGFEQRKKPNEELCADVWAFSPFWFEAIHQISRS